MSAERKQSDHVIAFQDGDGHMQTVRADEMRVCVPTSECMKFWVTVGACVVAVGIGVFFMVYQGPTSAYFAIGEGLLALGIGVLIPGPDYSKILPKRSSVSRPGSPARPA